MKLQNLAKFQNRTLETTLQIALFAVLLASTFLPRGVAAIPATAALLFFCFIAYRAREEKRAKRNEIEAAIDFIRKNVKHRTTAILRAIGPSIWEAERYADRAALLYKLADAQNRGNAAEYERLGGWKKAHDLRIQLDLFHKDYNPELLPQHAREEWNENPQDAVDRAFKTLREALDEAAEGSPLDEAISLLVSQRDNARTESSPRRLWR